MRGTYRNLKLQGEKNENWLMLWVQLVGPGLLALVIAAFVAAAASSS